ncbi:uncharacterized protein [Eurosta solidaginis]|uniref:uncharacterized protein n=1 Tax=Eurosta solidaginis TaxID=178769 RepID=UPI0035316E85
MLASAEMVTFTEKLIEEIKQFPVLYDRKYVRIKDGTEKEVAWELLKSRLPPDLNITVDAAKKRWRTLKDCYSKYLRSGNTSKRLEARYRSWRWARQMNYFKSHMLHTDGNNSEEAISRNSRKEKSNRRRTNATSNRIIKKRFKGHFEEDRRSQERSRLKTNVKSEPALEVKKAQKDEALNDPFNDPYQAITYDLSDYVEDTQQLETETTDVNITTNTKSSSYQNENSKDPLMGGNFDGIDLTFLGYASSIKKLSLRRQSLIKFTVAKLIMQQELAEQNENTEKECARKPIIVRTEIERL